LERCKSDLCGANRACNSSYVKLILFWVLVALLDAAWVGVGEFVERLRPAVGFGALDQASGVAGADTALAGSGGAFTGACVLGVDDGQPQEFDYGRQPAAGGDLDAVDVGAIARKIGASGLDLAT